MTVCTRHACQANVHPHVLDEPEKATRVRKVVRRIPQIVEMTIDFDFEDISIPQCIQAKPAHDERRMNLQL